MVYMLVCSMVQNLTPTLEGIFSDHATLNIELVKYVKILFIVKVEL